MTLWSLSLENDFKKFQDDMRDKMRLKIIEALKLSWFSAYILDSCQFVILKM